MSVKLNFALCGTTVTHISERIYKDVIYRCPHCKEDVIARKGNKKEHHFSHKPNSNCSVSSESLLHYEAKHFLAKKINEKDEIHIPIPLKLFEKKYRSFFKVMGISKYEISLTEMLHYYRKIKSEIEIKVDNYIADVVAINNSEDEKPFIFEIFVWHKNEENKVNYFIQKSIPYLELIPKKDGNSFLFEVSDASINDYIQKISKEISKSIVDLSYNSFEDQLIKKAQKNISREMVLSFEKEAMINIQKKIEHLNFRHYIDGEKYKKMNSIKSQGYMTIVKRQEELLDLSYKKSHKSGENFLMANDKYFISNEKNLLYSLIQKIHDFYDIEILIGKRANGTKEIVVGFNFILPNQTTTGKEMKNILKDIAQSIVENTKK
ncbi:competence protein CoiA family protein [Bacillus cereus group sp. MYBK77-1]|uniref:competence protein CoiA family protein n=1 Tax=unclassified Bacillus cereus group TaxID=2750818 RepID=UPI003F79C567